MSKKKGILLLGIGLPTAGLLLVAAGCAGNGRSRVDPLQPEDAALVKQTGKELMSGQPNWQNTFSRMAARKLRLEEFARIMVGLVIERCNKANIHPDSFGKFIEQDLAMRKFMTGLRATGETAAQPLLDLIRSGDSKARLYAAECAGRLGPCTLDDLCQELEKGRPSYVAVACVRALAYQKGKEKALVTLLTASRNSDVLLAGAAMVALGHQGGTQARNRLLQVLDGGKDPFLRRQAAVGVSWLGQLEFVPHMIRFLEERIKAGDIPGRDVANQSLRKLTGQVFGPGPRRWKQWWANRKR